MEIKVNIERNDYEQPTEIRQEVVQGICEAFLGRNCWTTYHPFSESAYRRADRYILKHENGKEYYGFDDEIHEKGLTFNGAEMKAAFEVLINAGYYMFVGYDYGTWKGYKCQKQPFNNDGWRQVKTFEDRID